MNTTGMNIMESVDLKQTEGGNREMIVKLKSKNPSYADLSEDQPYFVIGIESDDYRILNDAGKPYLYPAELFNVFDSSERSAPVSSQNRARNIVPDAE